MKRKTELLILVLLAILTMPVAVLAGTATDTVTVYVNVSVLAQITVTPIEVSWLQVSPGGAEQTTKALTVTNTGSVNLSYVYASVNSFAVEGTKPAGAAASQYASGGFLTLRNSTGDAGYRFVNRIDWNESSSLEVPSGMTKTNNAISWGWFKNHTLNYLWDIVNGSDGTCVNTTGMVFTIKKTGEGAGEQLDRNMGSNTQTGTVVANTTEWSTWTFPAGPLQSYCTAIYKDCKKIMVYQWDRNSTLPSCTNGTQTMYETTESDRFTPDELFTVNVTVWVPRGVPAGDTTNSTLTITASY